MEWFMCYLLITASFVTAGIILIVLMTALSMNKKFVHMVMSAFQDGVSEFLEDNFETCDEEEEVVE